MKSIKKKTSYNNGRRGGRTKGPAKRTKEDDVRFEAAFEILLSCVTGKEVR